MKLLLVEDDTALRDALEELLCREGYDVGKASNVRSAHAAMDSDIDLIMLDVGLPDGDGVSLCRQWRNEGVQTPILFLTAKDEELDVVRGLDAGGNDYVTKPFRIQELLSRIRALLRRNQKETTITRSGITLDMSKLQAIRDFERFYRAGHQSKNGAGIGLAIVKEIIQRHHGNITAGNGKHGLKMTISMPMLDRSLTNS